METETKIPTWAELVQREPGLLPDYLRVTDGIAFEVYIRTPNGIWNPENGMAEALCQMAALHWLRQKRAIRLYPRDYEGESDFIAIRVADNEPILGDSPSWRRDGLATFGGPDFDEALRSAVETVLDCRS